MKIKNNETIHKYLKRMFRAAGVKALHDPASDKCPSACGCKLSDDFPCRRFFPSDVVLQCTPGDWLSCRKCAYTPGTVECKKVGGGSYWRDEGEGCSIPVDKRKKDGRKKEKK